MTKNGTVIEVGWDFQKLCFRCHRYCTTPACFSDLFISKNPLEMQWEKLAWVLIPRMGNSFPF